AANCAVAIVVNDPPASYPVGTNAVVWTVTDIHGHAGSCTQEVIVVDSEPPLLNAPPTLTVSAEAGQCTATNVALGSPVTGDNCAVASVVNDPPASYPVGTNFVVWTATDIHGHVGSCTQEVIVVDSEPPSISCPAAVTVNTDAGQCTATNVALGGPVTRDNCAVASVANDTAASYPVGTNAVVWTVTDIHGHGRSCTQEVIVVDNEPPTISCPVDIVTNEATVAWTVSADDNCPGVAWSCTPPSGSTFTNGTTVVDCTA